VKYFNYKQAKSYHKKNNHITFKIKKAKNTSLLIFIDDSDGMFFYKPEKNHVEK